LALAAACHKDAVITTRTVTVHVPAACAADGGAYAEYYGLGDFEPAPPSTGHLLSDVGAALPELDPAVRALVVQASESVDGSSAPRLWEGMAPVPPSGDVDVLVLPALASCALTTPAGFGAGATVAPIAGARALVVGGAGNPTLPTFAASLDTGAVAQVGTDLLTPRTDATVTPFGGGGLVAGGRDPRPGGQVLASAEVYDPALDGFSQQQPIALSEARARHGAAQLATGETLLVGGWGADQKTALGSMEIVDPATGRVRTTGVAQLAFPRIAPTVLRLASGEILVAGGVDSNSAPVTQLEWFTPDASAPSPGKRVQPLVAGSARAFVALEGGGALAVVAPPANAPPGFQNVWVIEASGALEAAAPIQSMLTRPALFGGAQGAPVLWTGQFWLRWQPWTGAFAPLSVLDSAAVGASDAACAPDGGLAMWLDSSGRGLTALRFDTRNAYSTLPQMLLATDASELAPDRLASPTTIHFDTTVGGLVMAPGASAFVTDRTYADVTVDVTAPTGEPAMIVLRDEQGRELEVGGASCPATLGATLHVERRGASVTWSAAGSPATACAGSIGQDARVSVGVRAVASATRSVVRHLKVTRINP
jgi:hypothetical protein